MGRSDSLSNDRPAPVSVLRRLLFRGVCCSFLSVSFWPIQSWAAAVTVLLNSSPAHECYLEVERDAVNPDFEACDSAIEIQALGRKERAATHANRGILYAREGRLRAALADHNRAVKLAPELSATWINRANVYMRAQRFPEAMSDLDTAIRIADDRLGIAHYNRALLFQRIGDIESARSDGEKALALHPQSEEILGFARALNIVQLPDALPGTAPEAGDGEGSGEQPPASTGNRATSKQIRGKKNRQ